MASLRPRHGSRGTTYRVMWRTPDGKQRSRSLRDATEARRLLAEMTLAEREGRAPDPNSGAISLARWAEQVLATKPLKPKTRATYEDLLTARILPTFGACEIGSIQRNAIREAAAEPRGAFYAAGGFQRHQRASWCQSECHWKYADSSLPTSSRVRMTVVAYVRSVGPHRSETDNWPSVATVT